MQRYLFLGFLVLLTFSCGKSEEETAAIGDIRGVTWQLTDIGNKTLNNNIVTTLVFGDDNKISGNGGCNNYFGSYNLYTNGIAIGNIGATKKLCSEDVMEQEMNYLEILGKAKSIEFNDYKLEIDSTAEISSIKFSPQEN